MSITHPQPQSDQDLRARVAEQVKEKRKDFFYQIEDPCRQGCADRFLAAFAKVLEHTSYHGALDAYARVPMKCSRCATLCPVYQATGEARDIPCHRTNLLLKIYKRYFMASGHIKARVFKTYTITDDDVWDFAESAYRCTACRRCWLMAHLGRYILSEMRMIPRGLQVATRAQLEGPIFNTSAIPLPALQDSLEFLEEELHDLTGQDIKFPLGQKDCEYVFFAPVSDYMMEAETLMGNAAVLHAAGLGGKWSIGDANYDGINYGLLIGECGHASRSARLGLPLWGGPTPPPMVSSLEILYEAVKSGRIRLDPNKIEQRCTYHDPCNFSRMGWIVDQPRYVIKKFIPNFVEMTPNGRYNYCCGGGGGTVSLDEIKEFRMEIGGRKKVEQLKATGADIVIAPCANCKKQLGELIQYHGLDMEVKGLHDLVLQAIIWD